MRYQTLPADLYTRNRAKFTAALPQGSLAVLYANDLMPTNSDGHFRFQQNTNFFYLTGIDQEQCALVLFPSGPRERYREVLFIRRSDEHAKLWEGWKYSPDEARAASGIRDVRYFDQLEDFLLSTLCFADTVYLDFNEHDRNRIVYPTPAHRLAQRLQAEFPAHRIARANPILGDLRLAKEPEEIAQMQRAADITGHAYRRVLQTLKPGMIEYQVEAEILAEFLRHGASGPAYESIIASGGNACILHYIMNDQPCQDGDLVLMDFGAQYGNYAADLSRTIPVNGKFTPRQKAVYEAVLRVHNNAVQRLVPGADSEACHHAALADTEQELLQLGLLTDADIKAEKNRYDATRKYFPHGLGHPLGLDTHDVGSRFAPYRLGGVFTIEPGIYIPQEGIGVRIENDYVITPDGPRNLMAGFPITVEEIEAAMAS